MKVERSNFERLKVYQLAEGLANEIWSVAITWDFFAKETVGKQPVRAADSIGANIAEGMGRRSFTEDRRFVRTGRGPLNETRHCLRRAHQFANLRQRSTFGSARGTADGIEIKQNGRFVP
jgi:four helix bundle protein